MFNLQSSRIKFDYWKSTVESLVNGDASLPTSTLYYLDSNAKHNKSTFGCIVDRSNSKSPEFMFVDCEDPTDLDSDDLDDSQSIASCPSPTATIVQQMSPDTSPESSPDSSFVQVDVFDDMKRVNGQSCSSNCNGLSLNCDLLTSTKTSSTSIGSIGDDDEEEDEEDEDEDEDEDDDDEGDEEEEDEDEYHSAAEMK